MRRIILENVRKSFKSVTVLDDINLRCESGNIYGIVGYNGCGKTVLFKCICGFLKYDSGTIEIDDKVVGKDMDILTDAGIIIEEPGFLKNMSAFDNLDFLYRINHPRDKQHIYEILKLVGLEPESKKRAGKFSLGMKQRLAIAQAIMEEPDILILDEPMNGLDKRGISEMRELFLRKKREGKLIIMASHNREDIEILCDQVYEMDEGRLVRLR